MKNIKLLLFALLLGVCTSLSAQQVELTGFYGYQLNGKIKTYYGDFNVYDNPNYGGILGVEIRGNTFVELTYDRSDTEFEYVPSGITISTPTKLSVEYYMVGSSQQFGIDDKIKPYAGASLGLVRFHPKEAVDIEGNGSTVNIDDSYTFGATVQAGLKYYINDKIGIRLQAKLLLPMVMNGLFISGGTGGASGGASFNIPMVSGNFTGGLIFRLKN